jgi:rsbT antagonist protein RsbS
MSAQSVRAPILKQGDILIAAIQPSMTDTGLLHLRDELLNDVRRHRATGVIVDVTLLDVMDSFSARTLRGVAQAIQWLGAEAIVVGIQPDVAFSMVQLGLRLDGTMTALDLDEGLAMLQYRARGRPGHGR